jgi:hypothetical protein
MSEVVELVEAMIVLDIQLYILSDFEVLIPSFDLSFDPPFKGLI